MANSKPHALMLPYPAQGHVIPMLELAQRLVKQGIKVTFTNTEVTQKLVTSNWSDQQGAGELLQMVSIPDGLEPWEDRNDVYKMLSAILRTIPEKLEQLIETINRDESNKITCVIVDGCMGRAMQVVNKMGIRSAAFWSASVATLASAVCIQKLIDDGIISENGVPKNGQLMIQLLETLPPIKSENLVWTCFKDVATIEVAFKLMKEAGEAYKITERFICNSPTELEPAAFSLYPKVLQVGPLLASNRLANQSGHFWKDDSSCLSWLDEQEKISVIYIAFGSYTILNQTQFEELALGLELTNRPFLWVVRPGLTTLSIPAYPAGYMDRVGSRAKIVSWAPQQKVLAHPSLACFMSHCGWNSTLEGVSDGLPLLCWPYFVDQFYNETYICDIWKIGLGFKKEESGIITQEEIKAKVEHLLSDETFRNKTLNMKEKVMSSVTKDGLSENNLNNFIEWICA